MAEWKRHQELEIIAADDVAVILERSHSTGEIQDVLDQHPIGNQVLLLLHGPMVSITPSPPKFNHLAKPLSWSIAQIFEQEHDSNGTPQFTERLVEAIPPTIRTQSAQELSRRDHACLDGEHDLQQVVLSSAPCPMTQ